MALIRFWRASNCETKLGATSLIPLNTKRIAVDHGVRGCSVSQFEARQRYDNFAE
jgi:hypothetical protein